MQTPFQKLASNHGGVHLPEENTLDKNWLDLLREVLGHKVAQVTPSAIKASRGFELDLFWNHKFGALASYTDGTDVIGVHGETFHIVIDIFKAICSQPPMRRYLLGNSNSPQNSFEAHFLRETVGGTISVLPELQPFELEEEARRLAEAAVIFIGFHELAHAANGHAKWIAAIGAGELDEITSSAAFREDWPLTRQTLEYDADCAAVIDLLTAILRPDIDETSLPHRWILKEQGIFGTLQKCLASVSIVIEVMGLLFWIYESKVRPELSQKYHPPWIVRRYYCHQAIRTNLVRRAGWTDEKVEQFLAPARKAVLESAPLVLRRAIPTISAQDEEGYIQPIMQSYAQIWVQIHAYLDVHKRYGILAWA